MTTEYISCPYCDADEPVRWGEDNGYYARQCGACGFVYVNPRPRLDQIDEAAKTGLHETERGQLNVVGSLAFRKGKVRMFQSRLASLFDGDELAQADLRWLDVGTGFGELVEAIATLLDDGTRVTGIDPCAPKVRVAQARGLNVSPENLSSIIETYDVVSSINVFSHVPDPDAFVRSLKRVLNPGGDLILVTGNGADMSREDYPDPLYLPDHLIFAGEKHLTGILEKNGFDVVKVDRYRYFYRDVFPVFIAKQAAKRILGRPTEPIINRSSFRSLFIRATLRKDV